MAHHLLGVTLAGLALITAINLIGIAESAKVLVGPTMVFVVSVFAIIIVGFIRPHPAAVIGADLGPIRATEALGLVLILKAFAAGCSSLTGVEAIANAVPQFRAPIVKRAKHTEVALGALLATMLLGLAALIKLNQGSSGMRCRSRPVARHNNSCTHRRYRRHASDSLGLSICPPTPKAADLRSTFVVAAPKVRSTDLDNRSRGVKRQLR
jgi:amino acid transporter